MSDVEDFMPKDYEELQQLKNLREFAQGKPEPGPACESYGPTTQGQYAGQPAPTCRVTAHELLSQTISTLRLRINQLEALQRALPIELPYVADEALIQLIIDTRRG